MLLRSILDFLFPRKCLVCHQTLTSSEDSICVCCELTLPRTMLWNAAKEDNHVRGRYVDKVEIENVFPYFYFKPQGPVAQMVYSFKYKGNRHSAIVMGTKMAAELKDAGVFDGIDLLVPVPVTKARRRQRGFNQTEMLCQGIHAITGIEVMADALIRTNFIVSQTKLTTAERIMNIDGAFMLNHYVSASLMGKHIMLVDDVITTGATTTECAKVLKEVPFVKVSVLALAAKD